MTPPSPPGRALGPGSVLAVEHTLQCFTVTDVALALTHCRAGG